MRAVGILAALAVALALQTTLAHAVFGNRAAVDLVLVLVVYVAVAHGPIAGLVFGSVAGLIQDSLSGGVVGVGGLAKSLSGFLVGVLSRQFIVVNTLPRFVVFFLASVAHAACFLGLYAVIDPGGVGTTVGSVLAQAGINAVVGIVGVRIVERAPEWAQRRRMRRASLGARR